MNGVLFSCFAVQLLNWIVHLYFCMGHLFMLCAFLRGDPCHLFCLLGESVPRPGVCDQGGVFPEAQFARLQHQLPTRLARPGPL